MAFTEEQLEKCREAEVDPASLSDAPLSETGGRRLVVCCDGTWNQPNKTYVTNVVKVARNVLQTIESGSSSTQNNVSQVVYYDSGVGTAGFVDSLTGGGFGHGLELNIEQCYRFLIHNYQPGDKIYIFGFSRGAYTARSLVGLIRQCSILKKENAHLLQEGYDSYRSAEIKPSSPDSVKWRKKNSHTMPVIEFLGVWDTVGALGIPANRVISIPKYHIGTALRFLRDLPFIVGRKVSGKSYSEPEPASAPELSMTRSSASSYLRGRHQFHDMELSKYVKTAYHALAIDERRPIFTASIWSKPPDCVPGTYEPQEIKQAWFPGDHSDVGGGNKNEHNSALTLEWVARAAERSGLVFDESIWQEIERAKKQDWSISSSPAPLWWIAGSKRRAVGVLDGDTAFIHRAGLDRAEIPEHKYDPGNPGFEWLALKTRNESESQETEPPLVDSSDDKIAAAS